MRSSETPSIVGTANSAAGRATRGGMVSRAAFEPRLADGGGDTIDPDGLAEAISVGDEIGEYLHYSLAVGEHGRQLGGEGQAKRQTRLFGDCHEILIYGLYQSPGIVPLGDDRELTSLDPGHVEEILS